MMEHEGAGAVVFGHAGMKHWAHNTLSWVKVKLRNENGTAAASGVYKVRFHNGWVARHRLVEAGVLASPKAHRKVAPSNCTNVCGLVQGA